MDKEKIKCIYYIKDLRTDRIIYIGQTCNFIGRKYNHFGHTTKPIDLYMFEEGRKNFLMEKFDIDCTNMTEIERKMKEQELIQLYDTINNGLNKNQSGNITNNTKKYKEDYYQENKENIKKHNLELYYKNKDKVLERLKIYRNKEENKDRKKEYQHEYYQKNKELIREKRKEYNKQYKHEYYLKHKK